MKQPDKIGFAGNIKDFEFETNRDCHFTLSVDNQVIVDQIYTPENGMITIRLKDVVQECLTVQIPPFSSSSFFQESAAKTFTAKINDSTYTFIAIAGGVVGVDDIATFLKQNFLTWQPQTKRIIARQPEFLTYYASGDVTLAIEGHWDDYSWTHYIVLQEGLNTINLNYDVVCDFFQNSVDYFDVWVEDTNSRERLTYIQRYVPIPEPDRAQLYIFENSLGGIDTFLCSGTLTEKINTTGNLVKQYEATYDGDIDFSVCYTQQTGYLRDSSEGAWLRDFFLSRQRYHIAGSLRQIYIEDQENEFTPSEINSFEFEFYYCDQSRFQKIIRNRENLPELLEVANGDNLFFLTPRLSEYPVAQYDDELMLPVQHPYSGQWQHLPVSAIKSHVDLYDASYDTKGIAAFSYEHFIVEDGFVKINLGTINFDSYFYEQNGELHCKMNFVGDLDVSAFGCSSGTGGPGVDLVNDLTSTRTDAALTANMGRYLKSLIDGKASDWNSITGKPSAFPTTWDLVSGKPSAYTPSAHTHSATDVTSGIFSSSQIPELPITRISGLQATLDNVFSSAIWNRCFYERDGELHCKLNFVGDLDVSAFGCSSGTGGPGVDLVNDLTSTRTDAALTANMGRYLKSLIDGKASDWNSITGKPSAFPTTWDLVSGKPSAFTPSAHTHTWTDIPGRPDFDAIYVKKSGDTMSGNLTIGTNWVLGPGGNGLLFSDGANSNIGTRTGITKLRSGATNLVHLKNESGTDRGYTIWDGSNSNLTTVNWSVNQLSFPESQFNVNAPARSTLNPMSLRLWDVYNNNIGLTQKYATILEIYGRSGHWDHQLAFEGYKGSLFHRASTWNETTFEEWRKIWDSSNSNLSSVDWKANLLTANRVAVGGYNNTSYTLSTYSFISDRWVRTLGATGWFSETYGGGIYMSDTDYIRIYNNKRFYVGNNSAYSVYTNGGFTRDGYAGASWFNGHGALNVAITNNSAQTPLLVAFRAGQSPAATGASRLFSLELLNTGTTMYWAFGGVKRFDFTASGNFSATGEVSAYTASDARLKYNIRELDGLSYINRLRPVAFYWNDKARELAGDNRQHGYGLIAQELQNVLPDCVGNIYNSEFLGIGYEKLIPFLIAAVKQLSEEVKQLKQA